MENVSVLDPRPALVERPSSLLRSVLLRAAARFVRRSRIVFSSVFSCE